MVEYLKTKKGYFYKLKKNGEKKRISQEEYNKKNKTKKNKKMIGRVGEPIEQYLNYKKKYLFLKNLNTKKIIFNPDGEQIGGIMTKEKKLEIIELYNQLSSGNPSIDYDELSSRILEIIKSIVHEEIDLLEYPSEKKQLMHYDIELIYITVPTEERNYIGKVNIFALQCVIVFTENCYDTTKPFEVNLNNIYNHYNDLKKATNWKNYNSIKQEIIKIREFKSLYFAENGREYSTTNLGGIKILITPIKYFSLDEIIISYLDKKIFCGISYNFVWADGRKLTPIEFLEHDITHGNNYNGLCFQRSSHSIENLKSFYDHAVTTISDRIRLYSVKLMIFLLIHETFCDFFPNKPLDEKSFDRQYMLRKEQILTSITSTGFCSTERFLNPNDLFEALPRRVRTVYTDTKNKKVVIDYLDGIVNIYREELLKWILSLSSS